MADSDLAPDHRTAAAVWWPVVVVARWYQGKSRDGVPGRLRPLPWLVDTPALRVRPELLDVSYPDGPAEVYQLLTAYRPLPPWFRPSAERPVTRRPGGGSCGRPTLARSRRVT